MPALLALEIRHHKISFGRREQVIRFGYLPPENGFNFKKMSFLCPGCSSQPKIDPYVNFNNFQAKEIFSFSKFLTQMSR